MKDIGAILRHEIEKRGYQQKVLAFKAGFSTAHFWQLLQKQDLSCSQLERICKAMNLQPASFFDTTLDAECVGSDLHSEKVPTDNNDVKTLKKQLKDKQEIIDSQRETIASLQELLSMYRDKNGTRQSQNVS